jgi:hypothetical protein
MRRRSAIIGGSTGERHMQAPKAVIEAKIRGHGRHVGRAAGIGAAPAAIENPDRDETAPRWWYGSWDSGWWSPFEHREIRDDRVVWSARVLWRGTYTVTYLARATTPGVFIRPPAHAEEMYNPAVFGRSDGGVFTVRARP